MKKEEKRKEKKLDFITIGTVDISHYTNYSGISGEFFRGYCFFEFVDTWSPAMVGVEGQKILDFMKVSNAENSASWKKLHQTDSLDNSAHIKSS